MGDKLRVVIGSDFRGIAYKEALKEFLRNDPRVASVQDVGVTKGTDGAGGTDDTSTTGYPHIAVDAAEIVADGEADRALLICGTGLGMAISAGLVPGIRAVTVNDAYQVEGSVLLNNAQVITMGQMSISLHHAQALVDQWLGLRYDPASEWAPLMDAMVHYEAEYTAKAGSRTDPRAQAIACSVPNPA
ncbi:RpiB/LacA/LacB family sugar-phosphate isomerase [Streptomyces formicae]|uniref:RpiB/LacA/LacB family sugar-phosphate isomerase n=1 Tax=Streptomyces formicae TaxID=1616117 RepID=A0ABY3WQL9_9ACTN|nr:RpiB/LacA/LacB family sugar-phosphate isomerase [Streptomyces formicae]UNM14943.1 RpiB/LacA/LacB family sugar-phosphate isomerase [Streptomyces formicae]